MTKKTSKTQIIRAAFESGRKLTALDAWKLCRSLCLAEIVRDLKRDEHRGGIQDGKRVPFRGLPSFEKQEKGGLIWLI